MKADVLFAGVNVNIIIQKKAPEKSTFCGWRFKNKGHYIFKCWNPVGVYPPIKISGYAPALQPPGKIYVDANGYFHPFSKLW